MAVKRKQKWPIGKVVEISWFDAAARSRWDSAEEYYNHEIAPVVTVGYLLRDDSKQVTVIQSQGADMDDVNGGIAIPKSWIVKIKVLRK
jgi:hypothetical protein